MPEPLRPHRVTVTLRTTLGMGQPADDDAPAGTKMSALARALEALIVEHYTIGSVTKSEMTVCVHATEEAAFYPEGIRERVLDVVRAEDPAAMLVPETPAAPSPSTERSSERPCDAAGDGARSVIEEVRATKRRVIEGGGDPQFVYVRKETHKALMEETIAVLRRASITVTRRKWDEVLIDGLRVLPRCDLPPGVDFVVR